MAEVIFSLNGVQTKIRCEKEDLLKDICKKFSIAASVDTSNMLLLYKGNKIDLNATFLEQAKEEDKDKNIINIACIELYSKRKSKKDITNLDNNTGRKKSFRITNRKSILLTKNENISDLDNFNKNRIHNSLRKSLKKIEINDPPKNDVSLKNNSSINFDKMFNYNDFFRPYSLVIDLSKKNQKNQKNDIIEYNSVEIHFNERNKIYDNIKNDISIENRVEKEMNEFQVKFENFNNKIKEIINKLNQINENINLFYEITYNKKNNLELVEKDDEIINEFKNVIDNYQKFIDDINKAIEINKISNISETFNKIINSYKESNKDIIKYKINEGDKIIKVFGSNFVLNNWDNCKIICDEKEFRLTEYFDLRNWTKNNKILEIKLHVFREIKDLSFMFSDCSSLISVSKNITWNTENVISMRGMFAACTSLISLPDLSLFKTDKVKNMRGIFAGCEILESITDISNWNTENVTDMQYMFHNCSKLKTIPDISKWNTSNVTDMRFMFYNCSSLIGLPEISKWNVKKVNSFQGIFEGCKSLSTFPNISKWEMSKNADMKNMFNNCRRTLRVPGKFKKYLTYNKFEPKKK